MCLVFFIVWLIPIWQTRDIQPAEGKRQFDYENSARVTLVQTLGGIFFSITSFFTWRSLRNSEKTYYLADEKQVTERFTKAIEMLSSDQMEIRLGGIYALERITRDSEEDYASVVEILTAFIRTRSFQPQEDSGSLKHDVQATLSVLRRRKVENDEKLDYFNLNLHKANLRNLDMSGFVLKRANLSESDLGDTNLIGAVLDYANLVQANVKGANLQNASLKGANLRGIKWDEHTLLPETHKVMEAREIPQDLKVFLNIQ
jgi:hypothetical protein